MGEQKEKNKRARTWEKKKRLFVFFFSKIPSERYGYTNKKKKKEMNESRRNKREKRSLMGSGRMVHILSSSSKCL